MTDIFNEFFYNQRIHRLFVVQFSLAFLFAVIAFALLGGIAALSLWVGIMLVIAAGWHTKHSLAQVTDAEQGKRQLFRSTAIRYLAMTILLSISYTAGLMPGLLAAGLLLGYVVTYGYFYRLLRQERRARNAP